MAGIYIHVPFCKTRCIYCDFYSTTQSELRERYILALCQELRQRQEYLRGEAVSTIYLGGGTPSQLTESDFTAIFRTIDEVYGLHNCKEITLEANPDDLTDDYTKMLGTLPFNRISMGIQTFHEETLRLLRRRHTARQAVEAVERCRQAGFANISIDLIYGLPGETEQQWSNDLQQAIELGVEHISAYHLTYEEGTPLHAMLRQHSVNEVDEEQSVRFFAMLIESLQSAGYEHYEISNFCRPGRQSRHNSAYWQGVPYLGCGPSAHSFDTHSREWNVASLTSYIVGMESGKRDFEAETLDAATRYNEYVMTGIRTAWGISAEEVEQRFGTQMKAYCLQMAAPHLKNGYLEERDGRLRLTREGIFVSDGIMSDLMFVEE